MRPDQSGASSFQSAALGTHKTGERRWCRWRGDRKGDLCACVCVFLLWFPQHFQTHSRFVSYVSRTWLRHLTGISLRPKAEMLHHRPYSLYIWSLVNQSFLSWESGLCYCLVGVMSIHMQLWQIRLDHTANEKWGKQFNVSLFFFLNDNNRGNFKLKCQC